MRRVLATAFLVLAVSSGAARAMTTEQAMGALEKLRHEVEYCAKVVKTYGDTAAKAQAEWNYAEARAIANGMITYMEGSAMMCRRGGLKVEDQAEQLQKMTQARAKLCAAAKGLLPSPNGAKSAWLAAAREFIQAPLDGTIIGDAWKLLLEGLGLAEPDKEVCRQIATNLSAQKWPDFTTIPVEQR
jgi:hypothetical protein